MDDRPPFLFLLLFFFCDRPWTTVCLRGTVGIVISFVRSSIGVETIVKFYRGSSIIIAPRRYSYVVREGGENRSSGWNVRRCARELGNVRTLSR